MTRGGIRHGRPRVPVESCHSLSSWGRFQCALIWGELNEHDSFEAELGIRSAVLRFTRDGLQHRQEIAFTFTPCRFGGRRPWFICPRCGRRVGKVYLPCSMYYGGKRVTRFSCRFCYGLTYEQRQERDRYWSLLHRLERLEGLPGGEMSEDSIAKPLRMHRRTWERRLRRRAILIEAVNQADLESITRVLRQTGS